MRDVIIAADSYEAARYIWARLVPTDVLVVTNAEALAHIEIGRIYVAPGGAKVRGDLAVQAREIQWRQSDNEDYTHLPGLDAGL
jgi:hypothetical protein